MLLKENCVTRHVYVSLPAGVCKGRRKDWSPSASGTGHFGTWLGTVFPSKTETIFKISTTVISDQSMTVPLVKLSTYGPRSFAVAGPTIWNNLPEYLRDPELSIDNFRRQLKTFLFAQY